MLRQWKFCSHKMEILPVPWKISFSKICSAKLGNSALLHPSRNCALNFVIVESWHSEGTSMYYMYQTISHGRYYGTLEQVLNMGTRVAFSQMNGLVIKISAGFRSNQPHDLRIIQIQYNFASRFQLAVLSKSSQSSLAPHSLIRVLISFSLSFTWHKWQCCRKTLHRSMS